MLKWLVSWIIKQITHILLKIDRAELKKIPDNGPLLVVANHLNFLDAPVMITHLQPRPITGLVKKETWDKPLMAFLFNIWEGIPIDREVADFTAFQKAKAALKEGKILAVSPEGTRSGDGRLIRGKPGVAMLALQTEAPIVAVVYYGHENFKENIRRLKRTPMKIRVGEPFRIRLNGQPKNKETMQAITDAVMMEIARLLPKKYHGAYDQFELTMDNLIEFLE